MIKTKGQKKHFRVGLAGHRVTLYVGEKGEDGKPSTPPALRPGAPVSRFSGVDAASIVVAAYTPDDAKGVFCKLNGIISSSKEWTITETSEPTTPLDVGQVGENATPAEIARHAAGARAAARLVDGEPAELTEDELEEERAVEAFRATRRAAKTPSAPTEPAPPSSNMFPTNPLQVAPGGPVTDKKKGGTK